MDSTSCEHLRMGKECGLHYCCRYLVSGMDGIDTLAYASRKARESEAGFDRVWLWIWGSAFAISSSSCHSDGPSARNE